MVKKNLTQELLNDAARRGGRYLESLGKRRVGPQAQAVERLKQLETPLQDGALDPAAVLAELDEIGSPATVASAGGRYFGFVIGGSLPAALAANVLAAAWDQNAGLEIASPAAAAFEAAAMRWMVDLLGLPMGTGAGFVTGATMANFTGLAAARHALLEGVGWDVEADGLFGAPPLTVIVGDEVHVSVLKALSMLGLGRNRLVRVPVDGQGRMQAEALPTISGPAIVCLQAGNVNSGAFDPAEEVCAAAHDAGAWVHVDGAFGLWALVSPELRRLAAGVPDADSWAVDAHKWLNVPYDSGIAFIRRPEILQSAMMASAAYLVEDEMRQPFHYTPEFSRRARGIEVWAALRSLGRAGIVDLVERTCRLARRFAEGLTRAGFEVHNEVCLNQVLVSFGSAEETRRVIAALQADGTCWCGGTVWQGHTAMRISVSSWATTEADVDASLGAIIRIAGRQQ
jgi:glutamate/tyrosine decarboxylase-like PLP-dependent enzyme